ncbi:hypothetical protein RHMOL_Rhmol04G0206700 [Rhododendron molle]|uniref:Uncharacterized protein n=1 Tax=Rhododendron molle TaxID=49168 RepID=A0ACC0P312_RHOML|nr:hypothetical protein RHMOL_Rhmol04G0206700 [Rhododendron molle]
MKKKLKEEFLPFHQHLNVDSLTSFGKSKSLGAIPTENEPLNGTLEARNPSTCGKFECFKFGESSLQLEVGEKASEHVPNPLFVKEVIEPSCNDDYEYTNVPVFDEYPRDDLRMFLEMNVCLRLKMGVKICPSLLSLQMKTLEVILKMFPRSVTSLMRSFILIVKREDLFTLSRKGSSCIGNKDRKCKKGKELILLWVCYQSPKRLFLISR